MTLWNNTNSNINDNSYIDDNVMCARACGLDSLVVYFNVKLRDIWEGNMTIRSEIWTEDIHPLGFQDIREGITFKGLVLRNLKCSHNQQPRPWTTMLYLATLVPLTKFGKIPWSVPHSGGWGEGVGGWAPQQTRGRETASPNSSFRGPHTARRPRTGPHPCIT